MKPTFIISLLLFSFIATCTTLAQHSTYHISGRVTDTEGEPLPGATISIKGKGTGAVTSVDGTYTLQLPGTGTYLITASYVGYQPQEKRLTVGKEKRLSFRLSEDQFDLGTVVVWKNKERHFSEAGDLPLCRPAAADVDKPWHPNCSLP